MKRGRGRGIWKSSEQPPPPMLENMQQMPQAESIDFTSPIGDPIGNFDDSYDSDQKMMDEKKADPLRKVIGGKVKKAKKNPQEKNKQIGKLCQPKNAICCLNELRPGLEYKMDEARPGVCTITIDIDGEVFQGVGTTKVLAKQAAAEAALRSFAKQLLSLDPNVTPLPRNTDDKTPWITIASFAMYKLFRNWREDTSPTSGQETSAGYAIGVNPQMDQKDQPWTNVLNAHLDAGNTGNVSKDDANSPKQNPAKKLPANATSIHPSMLLHQMKPGLQYTIAQSTIENKKFFHMSADIDGQTFYGEGPTMKKAKFCLARDAVKVLYNVESVYESPA